LLDYKDDIEKQIGNSGQTLVNMGSAANKLTIGSSKKYAKDNVFDMDKEKAGTQSKINEIAAIEKEDDTRRNAEKLGAYSPTNPNKVDPAYITRAKKDLIDFKGKAADKRAPEAYYARQARLHGESEEMKKIDIEDIDQTTVLFQGAIAQNEHTKAVAIAKKMAKDGNFNNLLNKVGYDASFSGMQKFIKETVGHGMPEHEQLQIATEIGQLNEGNKVWNLARVVKVDTDGIMKWIPEDEHYRTTNWEIRKQHLQGLVRNTSRLAYVNESADEKFSFHPGGIDLLKGFDTEAGRREITNNMNVTALDSITKVPDWQNDLKRQGVPDGVIKALDAAHGKKR
jgi:hypothetical protein